MNLTDYLALSPLLILFVGALALLGMESFFEKISGRLASSIALFTFALSFVFASFSYTSQNVLLTPWVQFGPFSTFYTLFFIACGFITTLLAQDFFKQFSVPRSEYLFFLLAAVSGLIMIAISADFLTLFIGLETLSVSLYLLAGYMKPWKISHEASLKYFLTSSIAAAFLLYGIALLYGAFGTLNFEAIRNGAENVYKSPENTLLVGAIAFITLGLCFKAAVVPFHFWAPDVYDGATNPVTAFMAVGTKAGAIVALMRVFLLSLPTLDPAFSELLSFLAAFTLLLANFAAISQVQLRRFFAYSGISHAGFLLLPIIAKTPGNGSTSMAAIQFYLSVYALATFGAFAAISNLDKSENGVLVSDLKGFFFKSPLRAALLTLCLLTLAGIPPTAGFFAKFYVIKEAFEAGYFLLVAIALFTTVLAAAYYLRILGWMFNQAEGEALKSFSSQTALAGSVAFTALLALAIYPGLIA